MTATHQGLGHHAQDGIEVIDVQDDRYLYRAAAAGAAHQPGTSTGSYQLVVNLGKVRFLDSAGPAAPAATVPAGARA